MEINDCRSTEAAAPLQFAAWSDLLQEASTWFVSIRFGLKRGLGTKYMAFGFDMPASFGKFFPDNEMPGYWESLEHRFKELSAKGEATQEFFSDFKSDFRREFLFGQDVIGEELMPQEFVLSKPYKALGDIVTMGLGIAVTARFRELIEGLEPRRHQFLPVRITLPSGERFSTEFFTLRVLTELDAWDREQSDPECWKISRVVAKIRPPMADHAHGIALKRAVIGNHHVWRGFVSAETGISGFDFYISDVLKAAIDDAGLNMPPFYQLKDV